jgi:4-hydroxy-2-oxoheptanedioate aldolase
MARSLRERMRAGEPLIGSYVTIPSPEVVEVFAAAGMDYAVIDLQHSSPDWRTVAHMIRAADSRGIAPVVRSYTHEPAVLLKILDLGAEGLVLPGVASAEDIGAIANAAYYAPLGRRGACGHTRIGAYNSTRSEFPDHVRRQNERVFVWALLEDPEAVARAGDIAAVQPGASVIGVGRGDLSTLLGLAGQIDHPKVIAAAEGVIAEVAARSNGLCASSVMVQRPSDIADWHRRGCRLFTYNADAIFLTNAAREAVAAFRAATG